MGPVAGKTTTIIYAPIHTHIAFIEKFQNMKEKAIAGKVCRNYKKEWHIEKKKFT